MDLGLTAINFASFYSTSNYTFATYSLLVAQAKVMQR